MSRRGAVLGALVLLLTAACGSPQRLSGNVGPVGVTPASSGSHSESPSPSPTILFKNLDYGAAQGNPSGVDITFKVPADWQRTINDGGLRYDYSDAQTHALLRLDFSEPSGVGAVANWESYSQEFANMHPGYQLLKPIASVDCPTGANDCADWEFTFPQGGVRHVIDRAILGDNIAFAVYISAPTDVFPQAKAVFEYVVQTLTIG